MRAELLAELRAHLIRPFAALLGGSFVAAVAMAQQTCTNGIRVDGTISDQTGALVAGARVQSTQGQQTTTDVLGRFVLPCVPSSSTTITVEADGFAQFASPAQAVLGGTARLTLQLAIAAVQADVEVNADAPGMETDSGMGSPDLSSADVQRLPDDPDDLLRQLQMLASAAGGDPNAAVITVDGFQNGSALPPKSSIAAIRVNPDLFSAQNQWPPFGGGVIEIITKPGTPAVHGALFFTDSDGIFNARDPFSVTATPAGKQRYGFEFSGPIIAQKSGFSVALEKRDIDEFSVVNAITLGSDNAPAPLEQTVSAPQRLWIGSVRGDWQVSSNDLGTLSYSANVNNLANQGVGGLVLVDAGYSSQVSEYDLRFSNALTLNPNQLNETRIGYSWKRTAEISLSTAPAFEVAGFFTGGGATSQNLNDRERDLEIDDDMILTHGRNTVKFGAQALGYFVHDYDPDTFNGAYVFGGGSAPMLDGMNNPTGQTTTISGLEQYRRTLLNLPGGAPTTYQVNTGNPLVPFSQWLLGLFVNETLKVLPNLTFDGGLRYQIQTTPASFANFAPRAGFAWALDKKQTWVIHLRGGLFPRSALNLSEIAEVYRLNGVRQKSTEVYSPSFSDPLASVPGAIEINSVNQFPPSFGQMSTFLGYLNIEHEFPQGWHAALNFFSGADWDSLRIFNINAPMVADSIGVPPDPTTALVSPRPIAPSKNIFQYQNSGHLSGNLISFNLNQRKYKRLGLSFRYAHQNFKADVVGNGLDSPQSSYSEKGETGRVEWSKNNYFTFSGNLNLPGKVVLDTQFDGGDGAHYTITTGTDNNGDGDFNDRPSYASSPGPGVYATQFGLLTTNTVNGNVSRDIGTMPGPVHLDSNLSRTFTFNPKDKDHPRTFTLNARSANLLNHTNVTTVNTVLSSSAVGQPIAAEAARRVEFGVRFAF
jgi:hypothetical protein